jgi:hypothetical protein
MSNMRLRDSPLESLTPSVNTPLLQEHPVPRALLGIPMRFFFKILVILDGNLNKKSSHFIKQNAHLLHTKIRLCKVTSKDTRKSPVGFYKSTCLLGCKSNMKVKLFKHASIFFATYWNLI